MGDIDEVFSKKEKKWGQPSLSSLEKELEVAISPNHLVHIMMKRDTAKKQGFPVNNLNGDFEELTTSELPQIKRVPETQSKVSSSI